MREYNTVKEYLPLLFYKLEYGFVIVCFEICIVILYKNVYFSQIGSMYKVKIWIGPLRYFPQNKF